MTPRARQRRTRRRIRNAAGLLSLVAFLALLGSVGAVEQDLVPLLPGAIRYSSWERGTNENTNGLIRRWFPKGTDFSKVSVQEIQKVEDWLNAYPREILGFLSADAVFSTAFTACV